MLDYLLPIGSVVTLEEGKHKLMIFGMKNISKFKSVKALKNICAEYRSFYQIPIRAELLNVLHKNNFRKIVQGDNYA